MARVLFFGLLICSLLFLSYTTQGTCAEKDALLLIKNPVFADPSMPKVLFNHDKHVKFVDENGSDCSKCHKVTTEGFSKAVFQVGQQPKNKQMTYIHDSCTACHKTSGRGPLLVECRACHAQNATVAEANK